MRGLITICARGGSKGIPGKNTKIINNKPLIWYSLAVAEELSKKYDIDIFLSTESIEIKNIVSSLCFENVNIEYVRPDFLANDTAGKLDVIVDVYQYAERNKEVKYDFVIDLDVSSPLRTVEDVVSGIELLFKNDQALNLFSVSPANRNPYFNMLEENQNGFYELCKKGQFLTRQSSPKVFVINGSFYVFKKEFFLEKHKTVIIDKTLVYEVPHICFDLDHAIDFEFMSFLLENKKLDFDFDF